MDIREQRRMCDEARRLWRFHIDRWFDGDDNTDLDLAEAYMQLLWEIERDYWKRRYADK